VPRVCMIRQYYYPQDPRFRVQVEALAADYAVDVICLRRPGEKLRERAGNVAVYRVPFSHRRGDKLFQLVEYAAFFLIAGILASALHIRRRYRLIQVCSLPDALVFAALVPKLLGARVVLDLRETMPEFYATKFGVGMKHPLVRLIAFLEQASIRFADFSITCTEQMKEAFVARGANAEKIGIVLNSADETIFDPGRFPVSAPDPSRFTMVCHGSIEERYGLDTVIRAVAELRDEVPGIQFAIYGEGAYRPALEQLVDDLGVRAHVTFSDGFVPLDDLLWAIARADAGIVAMKRDAFRDLTHCLKMYDFISMRKPVICSRTRSVAAYFDDTCFQFFESDDPRDLARAIRELHANPMLAASMVERATETNEEYRWPNERIRYQDMIKRVMLGQPPLAATDSPRSASLGITHSRVEDRTVSHAQD
jgi:glycosyltransferase involved in cell wall biosynthesis